jgi:hypothetical protein
MAKTDTEKTSRARKLKWSEVKRMAQGNARKAKGRKAKKATPRKARKATSKTRKATPSKPDARTEASNGIPVIVAGRTLTDIAAGVGSTLAFIARCYKGKRSPSLALYFDLVEFTGLGYEGVKDTFCKSAKRARQTAANIKTQKKAAKQAAKAA